MDLIELIEFIENILKNRALFILIFLILIFLTL